MNNFFKYGFFILIAIIIVTFIFKGQNSSDKLYIEELEARVERLNVINSRLDNENLDIEKINKARKDSILALSLEIEEIEIKKNLIIRNYEKRIRDIDNFTNSQLDSFFIARYPSPRVESN